MNNFSFKTIKNFDKHIETSIPDYKNIHRLVLSLGTYFVKENSVVSDLGCSTGLLLKKMNSLYKIPSVKYFGYDTERNLTRSPHFKNNVVLVEEDLTKIAELKSDLVLSIFTLQFLPVGERLGLLKKIYDGLSGAFIITEKTYEESGFAQDIFTFAYYDFKLEQHTAQEILDKQRTLRKIMKPLSIKENEELFRLAGFKSVHRFYQSLNFVGWLCIK